MNGQNKKIGKRIIKYWPYYLMALPGLIYFFCNNYMPMFGVLLAFKRLDVTKGILRSDWIGFKNFEFLFRNKTTLHILRNTIVYNLAFLVIGMVLAIALAILLNEIRSKKLNQFYQSAILIPYVISWVIASYLVYAFLASDVGIINSSLFKPFGKEPLNWYMESKYWPFILTFCYMWKNIGYMMIIHYSSIVGISKDYYEAAYIDGATKWQSIIHITLPLIKTTVITLLILNLGRIITSDFGLFYQIPKNSGALYKVTQTLDVYVYNALMGNSDFGLSSAASVFQSAVGFIFVLITNAIARRYSKDSAIF